MKSSGVSAPLTGASKPTRHTPGLQFKRLHSTLPLWSVRVSDSHRAVGVHKSDDEIVWFFTGTHAEYDKLLATL